MSTAVVSSNTTILSNHGLEAPLHSSGCTLRFPDRVRLKQRLQAIGISSMISFVVADYEAPLSRVSNSTFFFGRLLTPIN